MALISGLDHFTVNTNRPEETVAFYTDILGLVDRPDRRPFDFPGAWLFVGDQAVVHLVFQEEDRGKPQGAFDHVAFRTDDFEAVVAKLDAAGLDYKASRLPELGMSQLFVRDPNGVRVEVSART